MQLPLYAAGEDATMVRREKPPRQPKRRRGGLGRGGGGEGGGGGGGGGGATEEGGNRRPLRKTAWRASRGIQTDLNKVRRLAPEPLETQELALRHCLVTEAVLVFTLSGREGGE